MDKDVEKYIDGKFESIIKTLKWIGVVLASILLAFSTVIGLNTVRSVNNKAYVVRHEVALSKTVTKKQMSRLIEISRLRKEIIITALGGAQTAEINALWKGLEELENLVAEDDYGIYYGKSVSDN